MSIRTSILYKIAHNILLWSAMLTILPAVAIFLYEQAQPFEKYVKYFHIIPYNTAYDVGDDILFDSFYESHEAVDIDWGQTVWCESGNGFVRTDTDTDSDQNFFVARVYPPYIKSILESLYDNQHIGPMEQEEILRQYANRSMEDGFTEGSKIIAWKLNIAKPVAGSTCYTRHKIHIHTPYFKIEKSYEIISSPWKYGKAEETL